MSNTTNPAVCSCGTLITTNSQFHRHEVDLGHVVTDVDNTFNDFCDYTTQDANFDALVDGSL